METQVRQQYIQHDIFTRAHKFSGALNDHRREPGSRFSNIIKNVFSDIAIFTMEMKLLWGDVFFIIRIYVLIW